MEGYVKVYNENDMNIFEAMRKPRNTIFFTFKVKDGKNKLMLEMNPNILIYENLPRRKIIRKMIQEIEEKFNVEGNVTVRRKPLKGELILVSKMEILK